MSTVDNATAIIQAARQGADAKPLTLGEVYAVATAEGGVRTIDLTGDQFRTQPARKTGRVTVRDVPSFVSYFTKHGDAGSEVYADTESLTVSAVLDAHTEDAARWREHRLVLALRWTAAWKSWAAVDGKLLSQEAFAEHLEDRLPDLVNPDAATMLEIAQSIQATTKAVFNGGVRLSSGQRQLSYVEETTATAGGKRNLVIPETFTLGVIPFEGAAPYTLGARLRYRITNGGTLSIGCKLDRPDEVLAAAFADIRKQLADAIDVPILNGSSG